MKIQQISTPLIKQHKILQVDYFTSKIIQHSKDNVQDWDHIKKISKPQQKLWQYLENQELHHHKYWKFKKSVNQQYFKKQLPEIYKNSIASDTLKSSQFLYSPTFQKNQSSIMGSSVPMDSSTSQFITNYEAWKDKTSKSQQKTMSNSIKKSKTSSINHNRSKSISRYWPFQDSFSVILQEDQKPSLKSGKRIQTSIYKRSVDQGVKRSFMTVKARPMSQQLTRGTQKVKSMIQKSQNPQSHPKNIRHRLSTLTEQHTFNDKIVKTQRKSILDTISRDKLIKFLNQSKSIDPKRKGIFSLDDLTDFQKFNLSFPKYMRLKTMKKINKHAYQNFVKQKHGNLEKFQNFILQQFPIQSDNKRKLQKIFQQITWQFKRVQRRKDAQKR